MVFVLSSADASVAIWHVLFVLRLTPLWLYGIFCCLSSPDASVAIWHGLFFWPDVSEAIMAFVLSVSA